VAYLSVRGSGRGEVTCFSKNLSQTGLERRCRGVDASREALVEMNVGEDRLDIEAIFHAHYERIARVIARVLKDPSRAEELAVEVFLKWSRNPGARGENASAWLYRVAVRAGLDELRRETRRSRRESLVRFFRPSPTPEDVRTAKEGQERVRAVLGVIQSRQAELLILRSHGLSYEELAAALSLNPASIGTYLIRAEQTFRKEYIKRYGPQ
jgi:RNA polymerase sigma-70 factor, ECF subfamily